MLVGLSVRPAKLLKMDVLERKRKTERVKPWVYVCRRCRCVEESLVEEIVRVILNEHGLHERDI